MPTLFWTGQISRPLRLAIDFGNVIAWISGNARDSSAMKERMKGGYNGEYSDIINRYDELSSFHYEKIANMLIQNVDCSGKEVIDVGCGTGILSIIALERHPSRMSCVDMSQLMLGKCREKSVAKGYTVDFVSFHEGDAEQLPFDDEAFDVVLSSMVLGMVPNQQTAVKEFSRVLRPGGTVALSTHGPAHYMEAIEAGIQSMNMRYFLAHRFEFWPRDENEIATFYRNAGLENIRTERSTWMHEFTNGSDLLDFYAATSALWWYAKLPPNLRGVETENTRNYFQKHNVTKVTSDVVFAYATKK